MEKNYKFEEINPVPTESIRINPMLNELDDTDLDKFKTDKTDKTDKKEKNEYGDMIEPEIATGRSSGDYRSDFDSDMGYHEEENDISDYDDDGISDEELSDGEENDEDAEEDIPSEEVNIDELAKSGDRYAAGYQLIGKRPNDFRAKHKGLFKREGSFIMRFIDRTVAKIYDKTKNGLLGDFFTSYDRLEEHTQASAIVSFPSKVASAFKKRRKTKIKEQIIFDDITGEEVAKIRERSSKKTSLVKKTVAVFEKSVLVNFIGRFLSTLLYLPMATYGALLLSTGITTILVQSAKGFWFAEGFNALSLILGVAYTLIAMITIFAGDIPLVRYLCESKIGSFILESVFGLFKKNIDTEKKVPKYGFWAFVLGIGIGLLSAVVSALDIFIAIAALVVAIGIAHNPESGVVTIAFVLPFAFAFVSGQKYLYLLILYVSLAWIVKLLRGQRRAKLGALDGWLLMFAAFILITSFVSVDTAEAWRHAAALIMPIMGYFLVSNLMSSRVWMARGVCAMLISGFAVAAYGIYEWIMLAIRLSWKFDKLLESSITSVFDTPETLSVYLIVIFCFALTGLSSKNSSGMRILSLDVLLPVMACIVFTMDVYAWMILVASVMIYSLIKSKKSAASIFGVFAIILFVLCLVSDILPAYLTGLAGSTFSGRIEIMHVTVEMIGKYAMTGIGLGETVFENLYNSLSQMDASYVSDSGNLLTEVLIRFGIVGVIFFVVTVVLVYRQAFSTYKAVNVRRYASVYSIAAVTAFTAVLLISGINYIWKDFSMAYTFWAIAGFVCAARKIALFDNAALSENDGLDIKLPISTFRKKVKKTK